MPVADVYKQRVISAVLKAMAEGNLTNASLAERASVDPGTVGDFLNGVRWPRPGTLDKIRQGLGWTYGAIDTIGRGQDAAVKPVTDDELADYRNPESAWRYSAVSRGQALPDLLAGINTGSEAEMRAALLLLTTLNTEAQDQLARTEVAKLAAEARWEEARWAARLIELRIGAVEQAIKDLAAHGERQNYDLAAYAPNQPMADSEADDDNGA